MTSITYNAVYTVLKANGYEVTKEPEEQKPPSKIEMKYDMRIGVETADGASYRRDHFIELEWISNDPGTIDDQVTKLMGILGKEYWAGPHFQMDLKPLQRARGAMYIITLVITWITWQTVTE